MTCGRKLVELMRGIRWFFERVWLYRSILWHDQDFDVDALWVLMEFKMRLMEKRFREGGIVGWQKQAKELRIASALCHRLVEDDYLLMATWHPWLDSGIEPPKWTDELCKTRGLEHFSKQPKRDIELLSRLLVRKSQTWWD